MPIYQDRRIKINAIKANKFLEKSNPNIKSIPFTIPSETIIAGGKYTVPIQSQDVYQLAPFDILIVNNSKNINCEYRIILNDGTKVIPLPRRAIMTADEQSFQKVEVENVNNLLQTEELFVTIQRSEL